MRHLSPVEVKKLIDEENPPFLLDVREIGEYEKCRIENSLLIPMQTIPSNLSKLPKKEGTELPDLEKEIVVICHHGIRSRMVGNFLEQQGFSHIINLSGGVAAWADHVDPSMARY